MSQLQGIDIKETALQPCKPLQIWDVYVTISHKTEHM